MDSQTKNEMLYKIQNEVNREVWQLLGVGFKLVPNQIRLIIQRNIDIIAKAVTNITTDNTDKVVEVLSSSDNGILIEGLLHSISSRMAHIADNYDVYFYPEPIGNYNFHYTRWLIMLVTKSADDNATPENSLPQICFDFIKKANITTVHE